jgi:hypothetical protein
VGLELLHDAPQFLQLWASINPARAVASDAKMVNRL